MQRLSAQHVLYVGKCSIVMGSLQTWPVQQCTLQCSVELSDLDVLLVRCDHAPDTKVLSPPTSPPTPSQCYPSNPT